VFDQLFRGKKRNPVCRKVGAAILSDPETDHATLKSIAIFHLQHLLFIFIIDGIFSVFRGAATTAWGFRGGGTARPGDGA